MPEHTYSIKLCVLPTSQAAAIQDIRNLCRGRVVTSHFKKEHDQTYVVVNGTFTGDPETFKYLKENWNTYAHPGDELYGILGFFEQEIEQ